MAEILNGEIISADSVQIYQGLNIGSAKPTEAEQAAVPHHLIDARPIAAQYTAGDFAKEAHHAIQDVVGRGKVPIVVGGTAFYLKTLVEGLPAHGMGASNAEIDAKVEEMLDGLDWMAAVEMLATKDPVYASNLSANDWRRLRRALEVHEMTGQPMPIPGAADPDAADFDFRCVFMTAPRVEMVEMIDNRCELIVESGLVEETIYLLANGMEDWTAGARAVGYRQAIEYLKADWFTTKTRSVQGQRRKFLRFVQQYQSATRRFARKQQVSASLNGMLHPALRLRLLLLFCFTLTCYLPVLQLSDPRWLQTSLPFNYPSFYLHLSLFLSLSLFLHFYVIRHGFGTKNQTIGGWSATKKTIWRRSQR
jgi:tRNA dimethylallyltransferase